MSPRSAILIVALTVAISTAAAGSAFPPMWPAPYSFTNGTETVTVDCAKFSMVAANSSMDLVSGFKRFLQSTFPHVCAAPPTSTAITQLVANIEDLHAPLQLYVDESYSLQLSSNSFVLHAKTVYGAYHGFETLSQLISFNHHDKLYSVDHMPWTITDMPRFPHRGILIDSCRHFLPLDTIFTIIDSVTYAKLNVIHWHIVDQQAFPFASEVYPKLAELGSYSEEEQFSTDDVKEVVEYARQRGVRVMVELDSPGHTAAMCNGLPEICPTPLCAPTYATALDFTKNETYDAIGALLGELASLLPEKLMHLGGDEVDTRCWGARQYIMDWLKWRNLTLDGGYEYYVQRVQGLAWKLQREVVGWQEIWNHFGTQLDKRTIIHQWLANSVTLPLNVTGHGYRLLWSDSSVWYLDHLSITWEQMYAAEPCNGLPDANCKLVLGGEACQWGETVDTSDVEQTIWPRAAAVAERLWSPRGMTNIDAAAPRIAAFRCLLNSRGVAAAPIDNPVARSAPPRPGSCFNQ